MKCAGLCCGVRILYKKGGGTVKGTAAVLLHWMKIIAGIKKEVRQPESNCAEGTGSFVQNLLWKEGQSL